MNNHYLIIFLALFSPAYTMDPPKQVDEVSQPKILLWNKEWYENNIAPDGMALFDCLDHLSLDKLTILDYDGFPEQAEHLAKKAHIVHSDITRHPYETHMPNIIIQKPENNKYDLVTVFDDMFIMTKSELSKTLWRNRSYLKESGKLFTRLRTTHNEKPIIEKIMLKLYPELYQALSFQKKESMPEKIHPDKIKFSGHYNKSDIEETCLSSGYDIISYKRKIYTIVISNITLYKKGLKCIFRNMLRHFGLSPESIKMFTPSFVDGVMGELSSDDSGNLIYPVDITELYLSIGTPTIRLNINNLFTGPLT